MSNKITYTDEPIGKVKIINDFLPEAKDLVLKEDNNNKEKLDIINLP